jgi:hypothetical protein
MISGVKVNIKYTSKILYDGDDELLGAFCPDTMTIHISKHSDIKSTMLHECCHAVLHISGCAERLTNSAEEAIVTAMEYGLRDYFNFV